MIMSLRKSLSEVSAPSPAWKCHTLFAHFSNSVSWVTPRSSVIASYSVRPGAFRLLLGSPPSRCEMTSVVRLSPPTLETPATGWPSTITRKLNPGYGLNRCGLVGNSAISAPRLASGRRVCGLLLDIDDDELGRLERRETHEDVDDAPVDVVLRG